MGIIVDGWSTGVHGDRLGFECFEGLFGVGEGVVEFDLWACHCRHCRFLVRCMEMGVGVASCVVGTMTMQGGL